MTTNEKLLMVAGRVPIIVSSFNEYGCECWHINDADDSSWMLYRDAVWRYYDGDYGTDYWPTREAAIAFLRSLSASEQPKAESEEGHWWCERCFAEKSPAQVTYQETCTRCGSPVEWKTANAPVEAAGRSEAGYRSITLKLAAFCARLSGHDGVPHDVAREGMRLTHEFKAVECGEAKADPDAILADTEGGERTNEREPPHTARARDCRDFTKALQLTHNQPEEMSYEGLGTFERLQ
jgi:hypothetical protein